MRITQSGTTTLYLNDINNARQNIVELQTQVATQKRVSKPSDDPQAASSILRLKSMLASNTQYTTNTNNALTMMDTTSSTLDSFASILSDVKTSIARASSSSAGSSELSTYASSIDQDLDELLSLANTKYNGKYIFSGTNTQEQPFTLAADRSSVSENANGITGSIKLPIADGLSQVTNLDGEQAFEGASIFNTLISIRNSLSSGSAPSTTDQQALDDAYSYVTGQSAKSGMIVSQLTNNQSSLASQNTQLQSMLSDQQDTDVASAITKEQSAETNLEAALQITAQTLPKSLLTYLSLT
ncbi:MAG TPA: flagellar hook-associated protein FlgL [Bacteroidota bacterium]|nr:flagellar hook-associated protein FlgL [Bacteroidota bacterium]